MPPLQGLPVTPFVGNNIHGSVTEASRMLSMITDTAQEPGYTGVPPSDQVHVSTATDPGTLLRLLHFERQMHRSTLETLQVREQRIQAIEEELQRKGTALNRRELCFSQYSDLLRKKNYEIQLLRNRIQALETNKEGFRLDRGAPKDRQIKVLKRKLARMSRETIGFGNASGTVENKETLAVETAASTVSVCCPSIEISLQK